MTSSGSRNKWRFPNYLSSGRTNEDLRGSVKKPGHPLEPRPIGPSQRKHKMNILFIIIAVIAIILAITGGLVQSVNFLLWVGIVLLILAVIAFLIRSIGGRSRV